MSIFKKRDEVRRQAFRMSKNGKIFIEAEEMWTFVGSKENDIWIWLASERRTELLLALMSEKETMPELPPCGTHLGVTQLK